MTQKEMIFFISNFFKKQTKFSGTGGEDVRRGGKRSKAEIMVSPFIMEVSEASSYGCCLVRFFGGQTGSSNTRHATTARASRSNFAKMTTSSLFPNTTFTNHEALPTLPEAFGSFLAVYPHYYDTQQADRIRDGEYSHLSNHVCLDYTGINLFSYMQMHPSAASSSSGPSPPPHFSVSYKSVSLKSHVESRNQEHDLNSGIRRRIMHLLRVADDEYSMVCTANTTTAFKLLAESYPFDSKKQLLSVYDHDSEGVNVMAESARKRGAEVMSASFTWPSMRIHSARLTKKLCKRKKRRKGLFVFPLQSRMTGARYPYLWMTVAQQNGWQVVLDACSLGPKDMDTFGLSLIQPDFIICSFFKVLGEDPSGFVGLLVKRSSVSVLASSAIAKSIGIVTLVPERRVDDDDDDDDDDGESATEMDVHCSESQLRENGVENGSADEKKTESTSNQRAKQAKRSEMGETWKARGGKGEPSSEIVEVGSYDSVQTEETTQEIRKENTEIECRGLDHADSLGVLLVGSRLRCISNWLVLALLKLKHPHSENGNSLVRIYGPRVKFDRGHALAFNLFDWKGEKVEPTVVQKLADRSNISLTRGFLQNIKFTGKYEAEKNVILERRVSEVTLVGKQAREGIDLGIHVLSVSLNFLTNFEDAYRLWAFIAKFLDADFVEKETWRYIALNQKMVEV